MENILEIINDSYSINDLSKKLFGYSNGKTNEKIKIILKQLNIEESFFDNKNKNIKYDRVKKNCPICNKEFETLNNSKKEKTVCSISCANSYFKHGVNNSDFDFSKTKMMYKKISDTINSKYVGEIEFGNRKKTSNGTVKLITKVCSNCNCEYKTYKKLQNFCSKNCSSKSLIVRKKLSDRVKEKVEKGTHKGWQSRKMESYPEIFFRNVLKNNKIKFEFNKPIKKRALGIDCDANYFLDFYIADANIDLEIDGKQHYYREDHDNVRDLALTQNGFEVYRIKWMSINNEKGKKYIKEEIDKFLDFYEKTLIKNPYICKTNNIKTNNIMTTFTQYQQQQINPTD
jgi:very-short-patch-repair endonuclease